jgi:hypothetical protein
MMAIYNDPDNYITLPRHIASPKRDHADVLPANIHEPDDGRINLIALPERPSIYRMAALGDQLPGYNYLAILGVQHHNTFV